MSSGNCDNVDHLYSISGIHYLQVKSYSQRQGDILRVPMGASLPHEGETSERGDVLRAVCYVRCRVNCTIFKYCKSST